jgi:hypothetical protein
MVNEIESVKPASTKLEERTWEIRFESFFDNTPVYYQRTHVTVKAGSIDVAADKAVKWLRANDSEWKFVAREHIQEIMRRDTVTEKVVVA